MYHGILSMSDGKREHEINKQVGFVSAVLVCGGEARAQFSNIDLCLVVNLCPYPHLWS